ncbi:MAG TPA: acetyl-CoA carboxylase biotin carboxyl carrier protein subunit [Bacteroidales bacterium]|nr:acetyl-CoA carboxylase biotin carboxyl carrier protein subunit [Bacteroidales bacterium]
MDDQKNTPEYRTFNFDDGNYQTLFTKKFANHKPHVPRDPKKIYAFIPGTILKVYVKEKEKVRKGDPLLVLQAMKMNNILTAEISGSIKKIYVKNGDMVPKTQLLMEFK